MLKNYFIVTLRNLMKKKLFVFINILGMGLAVGLCIVSYLNWSFRKNWDIGQANAHNIYRIQFWHEFDGQRDRYGISPMPLADHIRHNVKDINAVTKFVPRYASIRINDEVFVQAIAYADSSFFEMFTLELKSGRIDDFKNKTKIFISDELAKKYFDREDVIGEQITQINGNGLKEFEIGGVFKKWPLNSSFKFDAITLWSNLWDTQVNDGLRDADWKDWNTTFVQIKNPDKIGAVTQQLQRYVEQQNNARQDLKVKDFYLENFLGISNKSIHEPWIKGNYLRFGQPDAVVTIPSIMSGLLLLLACFNFTNTSIALSSQRLKEIGIRKVIGALKKQLIIQFLSENLFLCFLGFIAGLFIAELLVPAYDSLWPWLEISLSYSENTGILVFLLGLLVLTALLAGAYPAFYVTSFEPVNILKGKTKLGGTNWLTRVLLTIQFSISLVTIIFSVGFYQNAQYQKNYDLGFSTTGVISVRTNDEGAFNTFRNALAVNEDILKIAGTKDHVSNSFYSQTVKNESIEREVDIMDVGDEYFEAMNIKIISGRGFTRDSNTDMIESILVSEEFVKKFGWVDNPIGRRIVWRDTTQLYVIGVTKNIYSRALWLPIKPIMIRYTPPKNYTQLVIQVAPGKMESVNNFMKRKWDEIFPNIAYEGQFIDNELSLTNDTNRNVIIIFGFLGVFAGLMSATGLFTLVSLTILKRIKEIGIRKVLGASMSNIVVVISFEFIVVLLIASFVGGIVGYTMVDISMDAAWEYYKKVDAITLLTSVTIMMLLAVLTVGFKTINAAGMSPVKNLRTE
jgi:putative ABC transport system permease protein